MNTHPGRHKEQPCILEHSYYCAGCGNIFATAGDTHWRHPTSGKVFPCLYWPACSFMCYSHSNINTDDEVLVTALERGDTSPIELENLFGYVAFDEYIEELQTISQNGGDPEP